ncbi:MAG: CHAT domain-containing protein, partial [Myxococcota bacterium]
IALDDWLSLPQLPRLIVLNACNTGPPAGSYTVRLPELLAATGAAYVLTTRRAVDDKEATQFIDAFYRFGGVQRPTDAMRKAIQQSVQRGLTAWRHVELWMPTTEVRRSQPR